MKKGLVNIAQGTTEQLNVLKSFLLDSQVKYPEKRLKTHADGVIFAVEQAKKVPELENEIKTLHETIVGNLLDEKNYLKEINELEMKLEKCTG